MTLSYRWEPLNYLLSTGLHELGRKFYESYGNPKFNYDPDWAHYQKMQDDNILRFMAVRNDDKLVGFASVIVSPNLHDRSKSCAIIQDFYVEPMKGIVYPEVKLFWILEEQLKGIGAENITVSQVLKRQPKGKFYEFLGFDPTETIWVKSLTEGSA